MFKYKLQMQFPTFSIILRKFSVLYNQKSIPNTLYIYKNTFKTMGKILNTRSLSEGELAL